MELGTLLRWTARTLGAISALLLLAFAFGGSEHLHFAGDEAIAFLLFPVGVMLGFAVAWWRDLSGGLITVASLALFYLYMHALGKWPPGPYFLLFAAPAFLHIASALIARRKRGDGVHVGGRRGAGDDRDP